MSYPGEIYLQFKTALASSIGEGEAYLLLTPLDKPITKLRWAIAIAKGDKANKINYLLAAVLKSLGFVYDQTSKSDGNPFNVYYYDADDLNVTKDLFTAETFPADIDIPDSTGQIQFIPPKDPGPGIARELKVKPGPDKLFEFKSFEIPFFGIKGDGIRLPDLGPPTIDISLSLLDDKLLALNTSDKDIKYLSQDLKLVLETISGAQGDQWRGKFKIKRSIDSEFVDLIAQASVTGDSRRNRRDLGTLALSIHNWPQELQYNTLLSIDIFAGLSFKVPEEDWARVSLASELLTLRLPHNDPDDEKLPQIFLRPGNTCIKATISCPIIHAPKSVGETSNWLPLLEPGQTGVQVIDSSDDFNDLLNFSCEFCLPPIDDFSELDLGILESPLIEIKESKPDFASFLNKIKDISVHLAEKIGEGIGISFLDIGLPQFPGFIISDVESDNTLLNLRAFDGFNFPDLTAIDLTGWKLRIRTSLKLPTISQSQPSNKLRLEFSRDLPPIDVGDFIDIYIDNTPPNRVSGLRIAKVDNRTIYLDAQLPEFPADLGKVQVVCYKPKWFEEWRIKSVNLSNSATPKITLDGLAFPFTDINPELVFAVDFFPDISLPLFQSFLSGLLGNVPSVGFGINIPSPTFQFSRLKLEDLFIDGNWQLPIPLELSLRIPKNEIEFERLIVWLGLSLNLSNFRLLSDPLYFYFPSINQDKGVYTEVDTEITLVKKSLEQRFQPIDFDIFTLAFPTRKEIREAPNANNHDGYLSLSDREFVIGPVYNPPLDGAEPKLQAFFPGGMNPAAVQLGIEGIGALPDNNPDKSQFQSEYDRRFRLTLKTFWPEAWPNSGAGSSVIFRLNANGLTFFAELAKDEVFVDKAAKGNSSSGLLKDFKFAPQDKLGALDSRIVIIDNDLRAAEVFAKTEVPGLKNLVAIVTVSLKQKQKGKLPDVAASLELETKDKTPIAELSIGILQGKLDWLGMTLVWQPQEKDWDYSIKANGSLAFTGAAELIPDLEGLRVPNAIQFIGLDLRRLNLREARIPIKFPDDGAVKFSILGDLFGVTLKDLEMGWVWEGESPKPRLLSCKLADFEFKDPGAIEVKVGAGGLNIEFDERARIKLPSRLSVEVRLGPSISLAGEIGWIDTEVMGGSVNTPIERYFFIAGRGKVESFEVDFLVKLGTGKKKNGSQQINVVMYGGLGGLDVNLYPGVVLKQVGAGIGVNNRLAAISSRPTPEEIIQKIDKLNPSSIDSWQFVEENPFYLSIVVSAMLASNQGSDTILQAYVAQLIFSADINFTDIVAAGKLWLSTSVKGARDNLNNPALVGALVLSPRRKTLAVSLQSRQNPYIEKNELLKKLFAKGKLRLSFRLSPELVDYYLEEFSYRDSMFGASLEIGGSYRFAVFRRTVLLRSDLYASGQIGYSLRGGPGGFEFAGAVRLALGYGGLLSEDGALAYSYLDASASFSVSAWIEIAFEKSFKIFRKRITISWSIKFSARTPKLELKIRGNIGLRATSNYGVGIDVIVGINFPICGYRLKINVPVSSQPEIYDDIRGQVTAFEAQLNQFIEGQRNSISLFEVRSATRQLEPGALRDLRYDSQLAQVCREDMQQALASFLSDAAKRNARSKTLSNLATALNEPEQEQWLHYASSKPEGVDKGHHLLIPRANNSASEWLVPEYKQNGDEFTFINDVNRIIIRLSNWHKVKYRGEEIYSEGLLGLRSGVASSHVLFRNANDGNVLKQDSPGSLSWKVQFSRIEGIEEFFTIDKSLLPGGNLEVCRVKEIATFWNEDNISLEVNGVEEFADLKLGMLETAQEESPSQEIYGLFETVNYDTSLFDPRFESTDNRYSTLENQFKLPKGILSSDWRPADELDPGQTGGDLVKIDEVEQFRRKLRRRENHEFADPSPGEELERVRAQMTTNWVNELSRPGGPSSFGEIAYNNDDPDFVFGYLFSLQEDLNLEGSARVWIRRTGGNGNLQSVQVEEPEADKRLIDKITLLPIRQDFVVEQQSQGSRQPEVAYVQVKLPIRISNDLLKNGQEKLGRFQIFRQFPWEEKPLLLQDFIRSDIAYLEEPVAHGLFKDFKDKSFVPQADGSVRIRLPQVPSTSLPIGQLRGWFVLIYPSDENINLEESNSNKTLLQIREVIIQSEVETSSDETEVWLDLIGQDSKQVRTLNSYESLTYLLFAGGKIYQDPYIFTDKFLVEDRQFADLDQAKQGLMPMDTQVVYSLRIVPSGDTGDIPDLEKEGENGHYGSWSGVELYIPSPDPFPRDLWTVVDFDSLEVGGSKNTFTLRLVTLVDGVPQTAMLGDRPLDVDDFDLWYAESPLRQTGFYAGDNGEPAPPSKVDSSKVTIADVPRGPQFESSDGKRLLKVKKISGNSNDLPTFKIDENSLQGLQLGFGYRFFIRPKNSAPDSLLAPVSLAVVRELPTRWSAQTRLRPVEQLERFSQNVTSQVLQSNPELLDTTDFAAVDLFTNGYNALRINWQSQSLFDGGAEIVIRDFDDSSYVARQTIEVIEADIFAQERLNFDNASFWTLAPNYSLERVSQQFSYINVPQNIKFKLDQALADSPTTNWKFTLINSATGNQYYPASSGEPVAVVKNSDDTSSVWLPFGAYQSIDTTIKFVKPDGTFESKLLQNFLTEYFFRQEDSSTSIYNRLDQEYKKILQYLQYQKLILNPAIEESPKKNWQFQLIDSDTGIQYFPLSNGDTATIEIDSEDSSSIWLPVGVYQPHTSTTIKLYKTPPSSISIDTSLKNPEIPWVNLVKAEARFLNEIYQFIKSPLNLNDPQVGDLIRAMRHVLRAIVLGLNPEYPSKPATLSITNPDSVKNFVAGMAGLEAELRKLILAIEKIEPNALPKDETGYWAFNDQRLAKRLIGIIRRRLAVADDLFSLKDEVIVPRGFSKEITTLVRQGEWGKILDERNTILINNGKTGNFNLFPLTRDLDQLVNKGSLEELGVKLRLLSQDFQEKIKKAEKLAKVLPRAAGLSTFLDTLERQLKNLEISLVKRPHHELTTSADAQGMTVPQATPLISLLSDESRVKAPGEITPPPSPQIVELAKKIGRFAAINDKGQVRIWTANSQDLEYEKLREFQDAKSSQGDGDYSIQLFVYESRQWLLTFKQEGKTELWDAISGKREIEYSGSTIAVTFAPRATELNVIIVDTIDRRCLKFWKITQNSSEPVAIFKQKSDGTGVDLASVAYHAKDKWVVAGGQNGQLFVWRDLSKGDQEDPRSNLIEVADTNPIQHLLFIDVSEGTRLVTAQKNQLHVWDLESMNKTQVLLLKPDGSQETEDIHSLSFDALNLRLAVGLQTQVKVFDWENSDFVKPVNVSMEGAGSVAFLRSNGDSYLVTSDSQKIQIWTHGDTWIPAHPAIKSLENIKGLTTALMPAVTSTAARGVVSLFNFWERMGFALDIALVDDKNQVLRQPEILKQILDPLSTISDDSDDVYCFLLAGQEPDGDYRPTDIVGYSFVKVAIVPKTFHDLCRYTPESSQLKSEKLDQLKLWLDFRSITFGAQPIEAEIPILVEHIQALAQYVGLPIMDKDSRILPLQVEPQTERWLTVPSSAGWSHTAWAVPDRKGHRFRVAVRRVSRYEPLIRWVKQRIEPMELPRQMTLLEGKVTKVLSDNSVQFSTDSLKQNYLPSRNLLIEVFEGTGQGQQRSIHKIKTVGKTITVEIDPGDPWLKLLEIADSGCRIVTDSDKWATITVDPIHDPQQGEGTRELLVYRYPHSRYLQFSYQLPEAAARSIYNQISLIRSGYQGYETSFRYLLVEQPYPDKPSLTDILGKITAPPISDAPSTIYQYTMLPKAVDSQIKLFRHERLITLPQMPFFYSYRLDARAVYTSRPVESDRLELSDILPADPGLSPFAERRPSRIKLYQPSIKRLSPVSFQVTIYLTTNGDQLTADEKLSEPPAIVRQIHDLEVKAADLPDFRLDYGIFWRITDLLPIPNADSGLNTISDSKVYQEAGWVRLPWSEKYQLPNVDDPNQAKGKPVLSLSPASFNEPESPVDIVLLVNNKKVLGYCIQFKLTLKDNIQVFNDIGRYVLLGVREGSPAKALPFKVE
jgi:hypothetical protein